MPGVNINVQNGLLGQVVQTKDGVVGLVSTGVTVGNQGVCKRITSLANAETQNITSVTEPYAYNVLKEFYAEAGDGAVIYVLLYPEAITMVNMVDHAHASSAKKLLDYAQGEICVLGISRNPTGETSVPGNFIRADVTNSIAGSVTLISNFRTLNRPLRILLEGRTDVISATVPNLKTNTNNAVGIVLGGTANDGHASIGLALGRIAKSPVQRNLGRVKDGVLAGATAAYIGTTKVEDFANLTDAIDKGFITMRTYTGRTGYYFSDDRMCCPDTDDYNRLAYGRTIDKAQRIAYQTFLEEVNNEILVDATNGQIDATVVRFLEGKITQQVNGAMPGEISFFEAYMNPAQNVLSTGKVIITGRITPFGYAGVIEFNLGFNNPF